MTLIKSITLLNDQQKECLALLEEAAEEARDGHIISVAVVCVMKNGFVVNMAGRNAADLYLGAGRIQRDIERTLEHQRQKR